MDIIGKKHDLTVRSGSLKPDLVSTHVSHVKSTPVYAKRQSK